MSHRHTISTKINNLDVAKQALTTNSISFTERGSELILTSGVYRDTIIDTRTGSVRSGDTDNVRVSQADVSILQQYYAEALVRHDCMVKGIQITDRYMEMVQDENGVMQNCVKIHTA